jgi:5-methylcytosine-specific restriction endonuclease McrA
MTNALDSIASLSDAELLVEVARSAGTERTATARLIAVLAELDARRLYLGEGCSSLFTYCTQVLHLSEHSAYGRIEAARLARRWPAVLDALRTGDLTLTAICLLGRHLTPDNCEELLAAARHKSKREVEQLVAALAPKPDVRASIRKLPERTPREERRPENPASTMLPPPSGLAGALAALEIREDVQSGVARGCASMPGAQVGRTYADSGVDGVDAMPAAMSSLPRVRAAVIVPLAPERYKIQFTASRETHDKLRRAQELLRHTIPDGDVSAVVDRALTVLVEQLERRQLAAAKGPRQPRPSSAGSRYIPAAVKRAVWSRDGGQCTFVGTRGRCTERGFLEFHHIVPFAAGGETTVENLTLYCRAHNQHEGAQFFGPLLARVEKQGYNVMRRLGPDRALGTRRYLLNARWARSSVARSRDSARTFMLLSRQHHFRRHGTGEEGRKEAALA